MELMGSVLMSNVHLNGGGMHVDFVGNSVNTMLNRSVVINSVLIKRRHYMRVIHSASVMHLEEVYHVTSQVVEHFI